MRNIIETEAIRKIANNLQSQGYNVRAAHVKDFKAKGIQTPGSLRYPDIYATKKGEELIKEVESKEGLPSKDKDQRKDLRAYANRSSNRHFEVIVVNEKGNIVAGK